MQMKYTMEKHVKNLIISSKRMLRHPTIFKNEIKLNIKIKQNI
jgi:hypothetical protein